jgi:hypothetical protein
VDRYIVNILVPVCLLLSACAAARPAAVQPATRSVVVYLFEANRLDEAEVEALRLLQNPKHNPELHLMLGKIDWRKGKTNEMLRELSLYVKEAPPGPLRDEAQKVLNTH